MHLLLTFLIKTDYLFLSCPQTPPPLSPYYFTKISRKKKIPGYHCTETRKKLQNAKKIALKDYVCPVNRKTCLVLLKRFLSEGILEICCTSIVPLKILSIISLTDDVFYKQVCLTVLHTKIVVLSYQSVTLCLVCF